MGEGDRVTDRSRSYRNQLYSVVGEIDALGLKIHIRPEWWLKSRFIIDADGQPCTALKARALVGEQARYDSAHRSMKFAEAFGENTVIVLDGEENDAPPSAAETMQGIGFKAAAPREQVAASHLQALKGSLQSSDKKVSPEEKAGPWDPVKEARTDANTEKYVFYFYFW